VPPGDVDALSRALAQVLENPTCAERLVASGQQRAEEFSMGNLAAHYVELYEQIA
jgi:glycosyltransferase involved in cell wall biosynthesis